MSSDHEHEYDLLSPSELGGISQESKLKKAQEEKSIPSTTMDREQEILTPPGYVNEKRRFFEEAEANAEHEYELDVPRHQREEARTINYDREFPTLGNNLPVPRRRQDVFEDTSREQYIQTQQPQLGERRISGSHVEEAAAVVILPAQQRRSSTQQEDVLLVAPVSQQQGAQLAAGTRRLSQQQPDIIIQQDLGSQQQQFSTRRPSQQDLGQGYTTEQRWESQTQAVPQQRRLSQQWQDQQRNAGLSSTLYETDTTTQTSTGSTIGNKAAQVKDQVGTKAAQVKEQVKEGAANLGNKVVHAKDQVKEGAINAAHSIGNTATQVKQQVKNTAQVGAQKVQQTAAHMKEGLQYRGHQVGEKLQGTKQALRGAATNFSEKTAQWDRYPGPDRLAGFRNMLPPILENVIYYRNVPESIVAIVLSSVFLMLVGSNFSFMSLILGIIKYVLICSMVVSIALNFLQMAIPGMNRSNPLMRIVRPCVDQLVTRFCACNLIQQRNLRQQQQQSYVQQQQYYQQQQFQPQQMPMMQQTTMQGGFIPQGQQMAYSQPIYSQQAVYHTQCCNSLRNFIAEVFACESIPKTLGVILALQVGQFVFDHMSYTAILTLTFLCLFTIPKLYELHQGAFNHVIDSFENRVNTVFFRVKKNVDQISQDAQQSFPGMASQQRQGEYTETKREYYDKSYPQGQYDQDQGQYIVKQKQYTQEESDFQPLGQRGQPLRNMDYYENSLQQPIQDQRRFQEDQQWRQEQQRFDDSGQLISPQRY